MIAFTIFGWPVYRYGIFYGITFFLGYQILGRLASRQRMQRYSQVVDVLTTKKDDLFLWSMVGVIAGGRLGHVFLYDRSYYSQHLGEIMLINQGGMSFIGGVIGVTTVLAIFIKRWKLSFETMKLLGDGILCIVPIGIFLGRIGNGLNQELRGKPVSELSSACMNFVTTWGLTRVYPIVDNVLRVDTNTIQAVTEGLIPGLIVRCLMVVVYPKRTYPGLISGVFLVVYGVVRYLVEPLKALPSHEMVGVLSISQRVMILFVIVGVRLVSTTLLTTTKK